MEQPLNIEFVNKQLVWHPIVYDRDGSVLGTCEFLVSDSPTETEHTIMAFLSSIERQGADRRRTLYLALKDLRTFANQLTNILRESRSTREAAENGARLKTVMMLLRLLETCYQRERTFPVGISPERTGTDGD